MAFFQNQFPYVNFHELNLDWIIKRLAKTIRYDEPQNLTIQEQQTAANNIGAATMTNVTDAIQDAAVLYSKSQALTSAQQTQARSNIGAGTGDVTNSQLTQAINGSAVLFNATQNLTPSQKSKARENIGAGTSNVALSDVSSIVDESAVKYSATQMLSPSEQEMARLNIGAGTSDITNTDIVAAINNNSVLYSSAQSLTDEQQAMARNNIGVSASGESDAVTYTPQTLTVEQQEQARTNIGAGTGDSNITGADVDSAIADQSVRYDEPQELTVAQKIQARTNIGVADAINGSAVRYDAAQSLNDDQKAQARENIGAGTGGGSTDAVLYTPQSLDVAQQAQARSNIGVVNTVVRYDVAQNLTNIQKAQGHSNIGWQPYNLLDNSDFAPGHVINQRNSTGNTSTTFAFTIDRWQCRQTTISSTGLTLANGGAIVQRMEDSIYNLINRNYTFVIYTSSAVYVATGIWDTQSLDIPISIGTVTFGSNETFPYVSFTANTSIAITKVALYEGVYTSSTIPSYVYKGYSQEFNTCLRYLYVPQNVGNSINILIGYGAGTTTSNFRFFVIPPIVLRTMPSVTLNTTNIMLLNAMGEISGTVDSASILNFSNTNFLVFNCTGRFTVNYPSFVYLTNSSVFMLSAEI